MDESMVNLSVNYDEVPVTPGKKKKSYSITRKLEVIDFAIKNSIHSAARKFNIDRKQVRGWKNNEALLRREKNANARGGGMKRIQGAGRPIDDKDMDIVLAGWVRDRRALKQKVSRRMIVEKAKKLHTPVFPQVRSGEASFCASNGWLEKFLVRHNFRYRMPTTRCQKPPKEYAQKLVDFIIYLSKIHEKKKYSYVYAADETPIWMDPTQGKCIDFKGAREVNVLSTGHEKSRITVMLTAGSNGQRRQ